MHYRWLKSKELSLLEILMGLSEFPIFLKRLYFENGCNKKCVQELTSLVSKQNPHQKSATRHNTDADTLSKLLRQM